MLNVNSVFKFENFMLNVNSVFKFENSEALTRYEILFGKNRKFK